MQNLIIYFMKLCGIKNFICFSLATITLPTALIKQIKHKKYPKRQKKKTEQSKKLQREKLKLFKFSLFSSNQTNLNR